MINNVIIYIKMRQRRPFKYTAVDPFFLLAQHTVHFLCSDSPSSSTISAYGLGKISPPQLQ